MLGIFKSEGSVFNFATFLKMNYFMDVLIIISISLFISIISLYRKKYVLEVGSLIFPISYLIFMSFIIIASLILNNYVVVKNMHFVYFYKFIIFDYLLLNIYTLLSFKNKK